MESGDREDEPTPSRAIHLAREPDIVLAGLKVRPSLGEVEDASGRVRRLEPRVMQVLVALARADGGVVSRDELIASCWGGRIVGEDAINRVLGQLRALARWSGGAFEVATITRVGYRLVASQAPTEPAALENRRTRIGYGRFPRRLSWMLAGAAALVAILAAASFTWASRDVNRWTVGEYELVASDAGREEWGELSPDGRFLIYVLTEEGGTADIWYRNVDLGEPVRLVASADEDIAPAWSPDGRRIAFVRAGAGYEGREPCRIYVQPFPEGLERLVGRCPQSATATRLSWSPDGDAIYFSDSLHTTRMMVGIQRLDLATGRIRQVTRPGPAVTGDFNGAVSPDGRSLAFIRYESSDAASLMVLDLETGAERRLASDLGVSAWQDWSHDGRNLFVVSTRRGQWELWAYDPRRRFAPRRLLLTPHAIARPSAARDLISLGTWSSSQEIVRVGAEGESLVASGTNYNSVAVSRDGVVAFISQDTSAWIWLQQPGGRARRLLELEMTQPRMLAFSPEGRRLLFVGSETEGDTDLYLMDIASGGLTRLPSPGWRTNQGTFTADGRAIIHSSSNGTEGGVLRRELSDPTRATNLTGLGWPLSMAADEGVFAMSLNGGIWRIEPGRPPRRVVETLSATWTVERGAVYVLETLAGDTTVLRRHPLDGGPVEEMARGRIVDFAVDPSNGDLILVRTLQNSHNIGVISVRRG